MRPILLSVLLLGACAPSTPALDPEAGSCAGGKCDTPSDEDCVDRLVRMEHLGAAAAREACARKTCEVGRARTLNPAQTSFTNNAVRWSCADVPGVNAFSGDDRGQEYCEYFAIVQLPATDGARQMSEPAVVLGHERSARSLSLSAAQTDALDALGSQEVGRCVFTSWHTDVPGPVPACADPRGCPRVLDQPVGPELFRMTSGFNSNAAARALVESCFTEAPSVLFEDPYVRGCMLNHAINGTEWRKSDPAICAVAMRLRECGCSLQGGAGEQRPLASSLVPAQPTSGGVSLRGFPLGGWSAPDKLPSGCAYVDIGAEADGNPSRTIVSCALSASDLLKGAADLKGLCREKYGDNVVVHVPIPAAALSCRGGAPGCDLMPWIVTQP